MPTWEWGLDAVGVLLILVICYFVALMARRRVLGRHGGTFELSHRVRAGRPDQRRPQPRLRGDHAAEPEQVVL